MSDSLLRKLLAAPLILGAVWLGAKHILPVLLPFLLGGTLALAAEPLVHLGGKKLGLSRAVSAGLGVSVTLLLFLGLISLVGAVAVRQLGHFAETVPDLQRTAGQGLQLLRDWLIGVTEQTPEGVRPVLTRSVLNLFDDGSVLMEQVTKRIPGVLTSALSWVPNGALGLGTGILSGFMISARLPRLKRFFLEKLQPFREKYLPVLRRVRSSLGAWVKAQMKLTALSYGILLMGFVFLGIPKAPLCALPVALVDAVPMLGTGTVLIPWALVSFLQGQHLRGFGLLGIFAAVAVTRTVLEPRLVGKQLGLDPLLTLIALYFGYRFWGLLGMLSAPVLASAVKTALFSGNGNL